MRRIHHVGVVVKRLTDAYRFYRDVLGLPLLKEKTIPEQGVRAAIRNPMAPNDRAHAIGKRHH